jgi:phage-related minor tail protein
MFASGGGFSQGVAGEDGAEAVMPLKRGSDGKLGVAAAPATVIVNIVESPGNGGQQTRRSEGGVDIIDVMVEKIESHIASGITRGSGPVQSAMTRTYGLNRAVGSY